MTPLEIIFGGALGLMGITVTILLAVINAMGARIRQVESDVDQIREKYVRRDDLNGHLIAIGLSIAEVKDGMKDLTKLVLAALANSERK